MNKEIGKLWCNALRSGEYEQGRKSLQQGDKFCCLGVLCNLHAKMAGGKWERDYFAEDANLPEVVCEWAGLSGPNPSVRINGELRCLSVHNDEGRSFSEIADAIERDLLGEKSK